MDKERMIAIAITPVIVAMLAWWKEHREKKAAEKEESLRRSLDPAGDNGTGNNGRESD